MTGIVSRMHASRRASSPRTDARRRRPLRLVAALLLGAASLATGCNDADRALTGRWLATEPVQTSWLAGRPELTIGHYGPELTGVAWFLDVNGFPSEICPCGFIDHLSLDLDAQRFAASTDFCNGDIWIWRLELDDTQTPEVLSGTVEVKDEPDKVLDITFELVDTFIPDEKKLCDR